MEICQDKVLDNQKSCINLYVGGGSSLFKNSGGSSLLSGLGSTGGTSLFSNPSTGGANPISNQPGTGSSTGTFTNTTGAPSNNLFGNKPGAPPGGTSLFGGLGASSSLFSNAPSGLIGQKPGAGIIGTENQSTLQQPAQGNQPKTGFLPQTNVSASNLNIQSGLSSGAASIFGQKPGSTGGLFQQQQPPPVQPLSPGSQKPTLFTSQPQTGGSLFSTLGSMYSLIII